MKKFHFLIETCELAEDVPGNNYINVISKYPDLELEPNEEPVHEDEDSGYPGKFTKLLYLHDGDIHKLVTVPYKLPMLGVEPPEAKNIVFNIRMIVVITMCRTKKCGSL